MRVNFNQLNTINQNGLSNSIASINIKQTIKSKPKFIPSNKINIDIEKLKQLYIAGYSVLKMSNEFGVSRNVIVNRLKEIGYKIRNGSEANILRFANTTKEYRMQITEKAHNAIRGSKRSAAKKINSAISREKTANKSLKTYPFIGVGEIEVFNALVSNNLNPIAQKAFYIYNVDIFINPNIFIEVSCDPYPLKSQCFRKRSFREFRKKVENITNNKGIVVEINFIDLPCLSYFLQDIISFLKSISTNPPSTCKYFVISCYYELGAQKRDFNKGTFIKGSRSKNPKWHISEIDTLPFS